MSAAAPAAGEYVLRFGKHSGKRLADVERPYLEWLEAKDDLYPDTRAAITAELARRGSSSTTDARDDAKPLLPRKPRGAVDPLPKGLEGGEVFSIKLVCPSCGRTGIWSGTAEPA